MGYLLSRWYPHSYTYPYTTIDGPVNEFVDDERQNCEAQK